MKIFYDHQIFTGQNFGGISRYFYQLSRGLLNKNHQVINSVAYSDNIYTADHAIFNSKHFLIKSNFKGKRLLENYLNQQKTIQLIKKCEYDIFHPTYYGNYFIKTIKKNKPLVVTFHDLTVEKLGDRFPYLKGEDLLCRASLAKRANVIIAISENTKKDIVDLYGISPNKIRVVYHGNSLVPSTTVLNPEGKNINYILFVGRRDSYKNFGFFISAIADILKIEKKLNVICAGGNTFSNDELSTFHLLGIADQVKHKLINDSILAELYKNALFFVFPSLYEGFGIPVLESFACSCPVILSNRGALPEVGGSAAIYIDPENKDEIIDKVKRLLYDDNLRLEMVKKGKIQLKKFSWSTAVNQTENIYKGLL